MYLARRLYLTFTTPVVWVAEVTGEYIPFVPLPAYRLPSRLPKLTVYSHRNSSDLPFVIAELARLSKHSEWLINPLRFSAQKNIRPMITYPLTMQLYYFELRVLPYRVLHVDLARSRSRSSTVPIHNWVCFSVMKMEIQGLR